MRLAWSAAEAIELHRDDNVILHEVAHALDHGGRITNAQALGHPLGGRLASELALAHIRARRFDDCASLGVTTDKRSGELFAVAVERFFSAPLAFEDVSPGLYVGLTELFGLDPADALMALVQATSEEATADDDGRADTRHAPADPGATGVGCTTGTPIAVPGPK